MASFKNRQGTVVCMWRSILAMHAAIASPARTKRYTLFRAEWGWDACSDYSSLAVVILHAASAMAEQKLDAQIKALIEQIKRRPISSLIQGCCAVFPGEEISRVALHGWEFNPW
jgi:hypothetical protein